VFVKDVVAAAFAGMRPEALDANSNAK